MESNYTKSILNKFIEYFPELWIENLDWASNRLFLHIVYKEVDITFAAEQKTVANGK